MKALVVRIWQQLLHDKRSLAIMLLAPPVIMSLFYVLLGTSNYEPRIGYYDVPPMLEPQLSIVADAISVTNADERTKLLLDGQYDAVVYLEDEELHIAVLETNSKTGKAIRAIQNTFTDASPIKIVTESMYGSPDDSFFESMAYVFLAFGVFMFTFVVSGMAIGIDNFAHQGALKVGGDTIAVLGSGADVCYPKQHMKLYKEISDRGLIISELPDGTEPMPFRFPQRNRIIAGISEAVVVVEARTGSGSLITAEFANAQGKPVFAVPGNITSQYSLGTNKLIVEGAQPLTVIDDMFHLLGVSPRVDPDELEALGSDEREIYELVASIGEIPLDLISAKTGMDPFLVNSVVSVLEIKGYVDYSMGKVIPLKF